MKRHDCISIVRKNLMKQDTSLKYIYFDLSTINTWVGGKRIDQNKTGQRLTLGCIRKKKDGTTVVKDEKSFIAHDYCPFCGKKYKTK